MALPSYKLPTAIFNQLHKEMRLEQLQGTCTPAPNGSHQLEGKAQPHFPPSGTRGSFPKGQDSPAPNFEHPPKTLLGAQLPRGTSRAPGLQHRLRAPRAPELHKGSSDGRTQLSLATRLGWAGKELCRAPRLLKEPAVPQAGTELFWGAGSPRVQSRRAAERHGPQQLSVTRLKRPDPAFPGGGRGRPTAGKAPNNHEPGHSRGHRARRPRPSPAQPPYRPRRPRSPHREALRGARGRLRSSSPAAERRREGPALPWRTRCRAEASSGTLHRRQETPPNFRGRRPAARGSPIGRFKQATSRPAAAASRPATGAVCIVTESSSRAAAPSEKRLGPPVPRAGARG
ncbi:uncharacterized protein C10orf95-like [Indicator indicator]|uniref:uncharacterized protein C10orf95-like n=1 Tax=Indicator indicator TaxID=1002788 RepID=UPI0023DEAAA7|nr:uncharacterized protein C10orf95-like [Indicator indicator]